MDGGGSNRRKKSLMEVLKWQMTPTWKRGEGHVKNDSNTGESGVKRTFWAGGGHYRLERGSEKV